MAGQRLAELQAWRLLKRFEQLPLLRLAFQLPESQAQKQRGKDETVSAADGSFAFPAVTDTSLAAVFLPVQPVIEQDVIAHGPQGDVRLWVLNKSSFEPNSELKGRPINMICRLDKEPDSDGGIFGTCVEAK